MSMEWGYKKLEDVCDILDYMRKPITKGKRESGSIPYYGATGCLDYVKDYIFDEKLVLLGEDGAKWGAGENSSYIITGKTWVNNHAHTLRPKRNIVIDEFLVYYLNYANLLPFITGVTVPKLNQERMRAIIIPVPPITEQQRIVGILDAEFEKIDALKANAEKNLQNAKDLFQAALKKELEPKEGWTTMPLSKVSRDLFAGGDAPKNNMSKDKTPEYQVPIYANAVERDGLYGYTNVARVTEPSITVAGRGSGTGYIMKREEPYLPIVRLIVIIPNQEYVSNNYLYYYMRSMRLDSNGSAIPQLTIPMISNRNVSFPKSSEQYRIAEELSVIEESCKSLQDNYTQTLTLCDDLKQALLRKAFNGEL